MIPPLAGYVFLIYLWDVVVSRLSVIVPFRHDEAERLPKPSAKLTVSYLQSETTAPTVISFAPIPESDDGYTESSMTETETASSTPRIQSLTRISGGMTPINRVEDEPDEDEWEDAQ